MRSHTNLDKAGRRVNGCEEFPHIRDWQTGGRVSTGSFEGQFCWNPKGTSPEKSEVLVFLLFLHADTHCLLGGPTGVENPGTSPFIRFRHPSANRNSDLIAVSDGNTALRKSGRTMGIRTIRRTNWVSNPRLGSLRHSWYGLEGGPRPVLTCAFARGIS